MWVVDPFLYNRVANGAEQKLAEQHAFRAKVLGVFRLARHLRIKVGRFVILAHELVLNAILAFGWLAFPATRVRFDSPSQLRVHRFAKPVQTSCDPGLH